MENKINRNLVNIVKSYLTISKNEVKRNERLLIYGLNTFNLYYIQFNKNYLFSYCLFCDQPTYQFTYDTYELEEKLKWNVINKYLPCLNCYQTCNNKCEFINEIKSIRRIKLKLNLKEI